MRTLALILTAAVWAAPQVQPHGFPVPRAETEFRALLPFVYGWAQQSQGDVERFKRWALPYGPMDLEVRNAGYAEADALRNYFVGFAGAAFGVNPQALIASFHCGPSCVQYRRSYLIANLTKIDALVSAFRRCEGVHVLANWGIGDEFRVNELYRINGQVRVTQPSAIMGFVPSDVWIPADSDQYIRGLGADPAAVRSVVAEMGALSVAALVRDDVGIRVARIGIGDNESGLVFSSAGAPYKRGEKLKDGRDVTLIEQLRPGIYFYETT